MLRFRSLVPSRTLLGIVGIATVMGISACDSDDPDRPRSTFQFVNAHPDAEADPAMLTFNDATIFNNVAFKTTSKQFVTSTNTEHTAAVFINNEDDPAAELELRAERNNTYRLIFVKRGAGSGLISFTDTVSAPTSGNVKLRVINAAPSAGLVDLYVLDADDVLATATPVAEDVAFETASSYVSYAAGARHVVLVTAGTKTPLLDVDTFTLTNGQIATIVVMDNAGGGVPLQYVSLQDRGF